MKHVCLIICLFFLLSCNDQQESKEQENQAKTTTEKTTAEKRYDGFLCSDSLHLIEYILPDLSLDSSVIAETQKPFQSTFKHHHYEKFIEFNLSEGQLSSAIIEFRHFDDGEQIMKGIADHLKRFGGKVYQSQSFQNWILPMKGRSLIEINVFPSDTLISADLHRRQHI